MPAWAEPVHWALVILCGFLVAYGLWRRIRLWRMGRPARRTDHPGRRTGGLLLYALGQRRVLAQAYPGLMHGLIFYGFFAFFIGTSLVGIEIDAGLRILHGGFYLGFEAVLNAFALLFLLGLALAAFRRYLLRPERLNIRRDDALVLGLLAFIALTGLTIEVLRLRGQQPAWAQWSWLGNAVAHLFGPAKAGPSPLYPWVYWIHQSAVFGLVASLPYTKFKHIVTAPLSILFRRLDPPGALPKIEDIEEAEGTLGAGSVEQLTWKQLLDGDACTECGRCQDACPAHAARQPLSPKKLVIDLRDRMSDYAGALWKWQQPIVRALPWLRRLALGSGTPAQKSLVGGVIQDETLWSCTTCRACEQECPVFIEQVGDIVEMRRYLALEEGRLPDSLAQALRNAERQGNPWGQPRHQRAAWAEGLAVPRMADVGQADVLYWVGCAGSYDPRNQKVSQAMVQILRAAGVDFAILGEEEACHAEWARRAGEEHLYQVQAQQNVETLKQYRFQRIVTACPHCFNTLKNEYPQFGGQWPVLHHSQLIQELLAAGRLRPQKAVAGGRATYHDSCYLGRYNQVYGAPRQVVSSIPGLRLAELPRSRERGFCCGGGGGSMWMEHEPGRRVNDVRMDEIEKLHPDLLAVACPFCLIMLGEVVSGRGLGDSIHLKDIAELVAVSL
jgi:Fe-S oxidoreductase/nitrate reductase gamma subunit